MITKEFSGACNRTKLKMNKGGRDDAYNNNFERKKTVKKKEAGALMDKKEMLSGINLNKSNNECESTHGRAVLRQLKNKQLKRLR